jgi:RsiW-degrading membrane proteinase PrsW (M82 family)
MGRFRCRCGREIDLRQEPRGGVAICPECGDEVSTRAPGDTLSHPAPEARDDDDRRSSPREWFYLALGAALIPLVVHTLSPRGEGFEERLQRALAGADPALVDRVNQVMAAPDASIDDLLALLPGHRIDSEALLSRQTWHHYALGLLSSFVFALLIATLFPSERGRLWPLLLIGAFTGTLGILLLFGVQWAAAHAGGIRIHGKGAILVLILMAIGWSYRAALDPNLGWLESIAGYTFGVGLCEEICKALPVLWLIHSGRAPGWRETVRRGLASGAGFGISEAIFYAASQYNGVATANVYAVRFASCVALHAIWAGAAAISMWKARERFVGPREKPWISVLLKAIAVPMVLHGVYNTCLKKELDVVSLAAAAASVAWLTWQVELARSTERLSNKDFEPTIMSQGWAR